MRAQARDQERVGAKRLDAHKAAQVDQVDALQVVQRQLVVEQLRKAHDLVLAHHLARAHLAPARASGPAPAAALLQARATE